MKIKTRRIIYALLAFAPTMTFAATPCVVTGTGTISALCSILTFLSGTIASLIPIFFCLALVYFFYGIAMYIKNSGDPKKASDGKTIMIHGTIAIAVMTSIWGIAVVLGNLFGVQQDTTVTAPTTIPGL